VLVEATRRETAIEDTRSDNRVNHSIQRLEGKGEPWLPLDSHHATEHQAYETRNVARPIGVESMPVICSGSGVYPQFGNSGVHGSPKIQPTNLAQTMNNASVLH
jgi:hypothetical protein